MFLDILSRNHLSYAVALNDLYDLENEVKFTQFDLENEVKITRFDLVFVVPWYSCVPKLVRIRRIFLQILSQNHLKYVVE